MDIPNSNLSSEFLEEMQEWEVEDYKFFRHYHRFYAFRDPQASKGFKELMSICKQNYVEIEKLKR